MSDARGVAAAAPSTPRRSVDFVTVNAARGIDASTVGSLRRMSRRLGARVTVFDRGTVDLVRVTRGSVVVQRAPSSMAFPLDTLAVDPLDAGATIGSQVADVLATGAVAMSATSARLRGAVKADRITLRGWDGSTRTVTIGLVASDRSLDDAELMMSQAVAASLGFSRPFSVRIWSIPSRVRTVAAIASLRSSQREPALRVRYSWADPAAGSPLSQAQTKKLLGEFAIERRTAGRLRIDSEWETTHLVNRVLPIIGRVRCNRIVTEAATAALNELKDQGLASLIHGHDSRVNGGCFNARDARAPTGTTGHNVSRHAWGAAIDINPSTNRFGTPGHMPRAVIRAFRHHGFAWGGHFLIPDPTHFEYQGANIG